MRLSSRISYTDGLDYWRAYASGVFSTCKGFAEDTAREAAESKKFLTTNMTFIRVHSILAHATLMGRMVPNAKQVAFFSYPKGIIGRPLRSGNNGEYFVLGSGVGSNEFPFQKIVDLSALNARYSETLALVLDDLAAPYSDRLRSKFFTEDKVAEMFRNFADRSLAIKPVPNYG